MYVPYTKPILVDKNTEIQIISGLPNNPIGNPVNQYFFINQATGKKITLKENPSTNYPGNGAFTLVDGVHNTKGLAVTSEFLGFNGNDCEATIDLGEAKKISSVAVHFFQSNGDWIYAPKNVTLQSGNDGVIFAPLTTTNVVDTTATGNGTITLSTMANKLQNNARYLRIQVKNFGKIPSGMAGADNPAWLFLDEVEVM